MVIIIIIIIIVIIDFSSYLMALVFAASGQLGKSLLGKPEASVFA